VEYLLRRLQHCEHADQCVAAKLTHLFYAFSSLNRAHIRNGSMRFSPIHMPTIRIWAFLK